MCTKSGRGGGIKSPEPEAIDARVPGGCGGRAGRGVRSGRGTWEPRRRCVGGVDVRGGHRLCTKSGRNGGLKWPEPEAVTTMKGLVGALVDRVTPAMSRSPTRVPTGAARYRLCTLAERICGQRGVPAPGSHLGCQAGRTSTPAGLDSERVTPGVLPPPKQGPAGLARCVPSPEATVRAPDRDPGRALDITRASV